MDIGNGCSESLVRKIAEKGGGECELVKNEEDISDKIFIYWKIPWIIVWLIYIQAKK